ncbi:MAG: hypothetical protein M1836_006777 [Candelina mexicana]|nr:MAG: hypothetical protein M1836_006777 [Candelina mexicana]
MSYRLVGASLLNRWHKMLSLRQMSPASWHHDRFREEIQECHEARTYIEKLSETSDVFFSISRAKHDGYPIRELIPCNTPRHALVYAYMFGKFTLRWGFHLTAAWLSGVEDWKGVREVTNPGKDHKLELVALRHGIDAEKFGRVGRKLRWVWPLLP